MLNQYLDEEYINNNLPDYEVKPEDLGTTDTYHEEKILKKYLAYDKDVQILIYKAAIQLAIVGYGKKNYGFIRINDQKTLQLTELFDNLKIKHMENQNSKYNDDDLSARRLLRLFRLPIKKFIETYQRPSYLWLKYANKENLGFMSICYPGSEHLIKTKEEAYFLLETYGQLDTVQNTKFRLRLQRVFIARGLLNPEYFIDKKY